MAWCTAGSMRVTGVFLVYKKLNEGMMAHSLGIVKIQACPRTVIRRVHLGGDNPLIPSQIFKVHGQIVNLAFACMAGVK